MTSTYYWVITARIHSTREDNIYTWECRSVHLWWGGGGVPHLADRGGGGRGGYPIQLTEYPHPRLDEVLPIQDWTGYPLVQDWMGYTPSKTGWGIPPPPPPIRRLISKVCTCYAAGGVPLAFTQDFLVGLQVYMY